MSEMQNVITQLQVIAKSIEKPNFRFGVSIIDVITTALAFVLSLALNEALTASFKTLLKPHTKERYDLKSAWTYACAMIVMIPTLLFIFLGCVRPKLVSSNAIGGTCTGKSKWIVPLIGGILLAIIIIVPGVMSDGNKKDDDHVKADNEQAGAL